MGKAGLRNDESCDEYEGEDKNTKAASEHAKREHYLSWLRADARSKEDGCDDDDDDDDDRDIAFVMNLRTCLVKKYT